VKKEFLPTRRSHPYQGEKVIPMEKKNYSKVKNSPQIKLSVSKRKVLKINTFSSKREER